MLSRSRTTAAEGSYMAITYPHILVLIAALLAVANLARGQSITIGDKPECQSCRIEMRPVVTIMDSDAHITGDVSTLARLPDGSFVVGTLGAKQALVFDGKGKYVRAIGRGGAGPGEHTFLERVLTDAKGQIHTWDLGLNRHSVFEASGSLLHTDPVSMVSAIQTSGLTATGQLVTNGYNSVGSGRPSAVQVVNAKGVVVAQGDVGTYDRKRVWTYLRRLVGLKNGNILSFRTFEYQFEILSPQLNRVQAFRRDASWFPAITDSTVTPSSGMFDVPAATIVRDAWVDEQERLWVVFGVRSTEWRPMPKSRSISMSDPQAKRPRYDTVVEVLDLKRRRLLVHQRFAGSGDAAFQHGYIARTSTETDGTLKVAIEKWELLR